MIVSPKSKVVLVVIVVMLLVAVGVGVGVYLDRAIPLGTSSYWESGWLELGDGVEMKIRVAMSPTPVPTATVEPSPVPTETATLTVEPSPTPTVIVEPSPTLTETPVPTATIGPSGGECTIVLQPGSVRYDGGEVPPGAVICLEAGDYSKIVFQGLEGTAEEPITIRNHGGRVRMTDPGSGWNEIWIKESAHFRLTGTGTPGVEYGFYFTEGLLINEWSHHFEVDHVEIEARIRVNNSVATDFEMTDVRIHHNYIHNAGATGIYFGHCCYDDHPGQYVSRRLELDNNVIENSYDRGLKLASCVEGGLVHHNIVRNLTGPDADAGLLVGEGCEGCKVYNNEFYDLVTRAIAVTGQTTTAEIYNNLMVNTGQGDPSDPIDRMDAIIAWRDGHRIYNNTIIGAKRHGIALRDADSYAYNNIVLGTVDVPIRAGKNPDENFHHNLTKDDGYTVENFGFVAPGNGDYHLTEGSPAVDAGAGGLGPRWDLDDNPRPVGVTCDVGAYEFE